MKVGIVGCGHVARVHLDALTRLREIEIAGVHDVDETRAASTARAFGIERTFASPGQLFEQADVVHVLTPPQSHKALTIQALEAGCDVLVEKPIALDAVEADQMIAAAERCRRTLGVCHNCLFDPAVLHARKLFDGGRLGEVVGVEIFWRTWVERDNRYATRRWLRDLPGGFFHEAMPHLVYLQRAFLGELSVVSAAAMMAPGPRQPSGELRAIFAGARGLGSACLSFGSNPHQIVLRVYGTEMSVQVDLVRHVLVRLGSSARGGRLRRASSDVARGGQLATRTLTAIAAGVGKPRNRAHANLIERFYEALQAGETPPVTGADGRSVVAALDQLWTVLEQR